MAAIHTVALLNFLKSTLNVNRYENLVLLNASNQKECLVDRKTVRVTERGMHIV